jgi:surface protein
MFPFPFSFLGTSISAAFNYSASAYCQDASDPTPTITGTSGGTFTAAEKFFPFQMQFDTSGGKTITIPATVGSSFTVDWGDGNTTTETGGTISHAYDSGIATSIVSIGAQDDTGPFTSFQFNNNGSKSDLLDVPQWGSIVWSSFYRMFKGCNNTSFTQISATDNPISNNVILMNEMFRHATYFNGDISKFDTSNVENMQYLFNNAINFNQDISSWNTSNVTNMQYVFNNASSFNQNISSWDTSNVENMKYIFVNATSFNQSLNSWNVSNVENMERMFNNAQAFNQDISSWDVSKVTNMVTMFKNATSFNQDISSWDVSKVTNMGTMLRASSFNQNLSSWALNSSLSSLNYIFEDTNMSTANYTDTIVGWAVTVYKNSAPYTVDMGNQLNRTFDRARTSDNASGQTYAVKYGSDWTATGWQDAGDARDYLTDTLANLGANWSITSDQEIN